MLLWWPRSLFVRSARALAGQLESLGLNEPSECGAGKYRKGNASTDTDLPLMAYSCKSLFLEEDRFLKNITKKPPEPVNVCLFINQISLLELDVNEDKMTHSAAPP